MSSRLLYAGQGPAALQHPTPFEFTDEAEVDKALGKSRALKTQFPGYCASPLLLPQGNREEGFAFP